MVMVVLTPKVCDDEGRRLMTAIQSVSTGQIQPLARPPELKAPSPDTKPQAAISQDAVASSDAKAGKSLTALSIGIGVVAVAAGAVVLATRGRVRPTSAAKALTAVGEEAAGAAKVASTAEAVGATKAAWPVANPKAYYSNYASFGGHFKKAITDSDLAKFLQPYKDVVKGFELSVPEYAGTYRRYSVRLFGDKAGKLDQVMRKVESHFHSLGKSVQTTNENFRFRFS